jgi:glycine C-acetyltransferase
MKEIKAIHDWMKTSGRQFHRIIRTESLPDPVFRCEGREVISFSTNNYLGLSADPRLIEMARRGLEKYGVGNCESRLLGGDLEIYLHLEDRLARLKRKEAALLFATGYLTNLGVLSALVNSTKIARVYGYRPKKYCRYAYFTDEFNHLSIREGIRMSEANRVTYRHADMNDLERKLKIAETDIRIIASDGVFSQDGDVVPLPDMMSLAEKYDAWVYIDDAHGTGVLGQTGGGTTEYFNLFPSRLICMGTLSKAYGAIGGFIATDRDVVDILRFSCPAFGFTSTLPPDQACAVAGAMDIVRDEPERRQRLWDNQRYFVRQIDGLGFRLINRSTCILPVLIGDEALCWRFSHVLDQRGIHVDSIAFPAVPLGRSRLRFIMNAHHTRAQIDRVCQILAEVKDSVRNALSESYEKSDGITTTSEPGLPSHPS